MRCAIMRSPSIGTAERKSATLGSAVALRSCLENDFGAPIARSAGTDRLFGARQPYAGRAQQKLRDSRLKQKQQESTQG